MTTPSTGQPPRVLVLSGEPLTAALLALLLELDSFTPVFAAPGERADEAVSRLRPLIVVVADFELDESRSDIFVAKVVKQRIGLVVFGSAARRDELREWADERHIPWLVLPADASEIGKRVAEAAAMAGERRAGAEPRKPRTEVGADGSLHFLDGSGRRWAVLDRRGSDRREGGTRQDRGSPARDSEDSYRLFIAEDGEERRCALRGREFDDDSPADLARQLDRADSV